MLKFEESPVYIQHVDGTAFTTKEMMLENEWKIFALGKDLVVEGMWYQYQDIHKVTWRSPDKKMCNQIYHLLVDRRH